MPTVEGMVNSYKRYPIEKSVALVGVGSIGVTMRDALVTAYDPPPTGANSSIQARDEWLASRHQRIETDGIISEIGLAVVALCALRVTFRGIRRRVAMRQAKNKA